jgi:hypothetical protein
LMLLGEVQCEEMVPGSHAAFAVGGYANAIQWQCEWKILTWFWMRSLTRSMGAAAVLETAAEIPPTVVQR